MIVNSDALGDSCFDLGVIFCADVEGRLGKREIRRRSWEKGRNEEMKTGREYRWKGKKGETDRWTETLTVTERDQRVDRFSIQAVISEKNSFDS